MTGNQLQEIKERIEKAMSRWELVMDDRSEGDLGVSIDLNRALALLASVQEENMCPTCKGIGSCDRPQNYPDGEGYSTGECPDCRGLGTYRAWAEKQIADAERANLTSRNLLGLSEDLKKDLQEQSDKKDKQISSLTAQRDEAIKEIGVWSRKAGLLTAEVERLKSEQKHIKNLCRVFDEFGKLFDPECVLPDLADNVMYMVATKQQQLSAKDELVEKLATSIKDFLGIVNDSRGIDGFHLNGDVLLWEQVEQIAELEAALAAAGQKEKK